MNNQNSKLYLCGLVLPAAHMAKLAATAAPVLLVLFRRAVSWIKAELVEGLTAYLAIQHLQKEISQNDF